jgi:hypothetical protein
MVLADPKQDPKLGSDAAAGPTMTEKSLPEPPKPAAGWLEPAPWTTGELRERIEAGEFASPTVHRWRDQLTRIKDDLTDILASRSVIDKLREIVARNPRLQISNFFMERILRWYGTSTLVLVHRELDRRRDTVSLLRLLEDIQRNPGELNRLSVGRDTLDVDLVQAEIDELVTAAEEVQALRHTQYAHRAATGPALDSITLGTIHALVDVEEKLVEKYYNVLFYVSCLGLTPVDHTDWHEILTFPWIMPPERDTSVPHAATPAVILKLFEALRPEDRELVRKALLES